jgi:putative ABC transport system permease protein
MFKNYLKIAFRNLVRHKAFSLINIFGLAVGMACTILILLWVRHELSYDTFHRNAEKIYLVLRGDNAGFSAATSKLLGPALREELPEVEKSTCFIPLPESITCVVQYGGKTFEESIALADSQFFNMFSFNAKEGDLAGALNDPHSMVITDEIAKKYFGEDNAVGKLLSFSAIGRRLTMRVSAVLNDIPENSHIRDNIILSVDVLPLLGIPEFGWQNQSYYTYIQLRNKLKNTSDIRELSSRIKACELRHDPRQPQSLKYSLLPLTDVHLHGGGLKFFRATGDIKYVRIFTTIAVIILLIAALNYVNLSTALSLKRSGEVAVRKTVGANRGSLMLQFLGESLLISVFALGFALLLAEIFLPDFNALSGKNLSIRYSNPSFLITISLITLFTGIGAGGYPALFLSSFKPVQILKGNLKLNPGGVFARKGLVVFQFALSIVIVTCTIVVFYQLSFIRKSNLGLDRENILCIKAAGETSNRYDIFKNEMQKDPGVISICRSEPLANGALSKTFSVSWVEKLSNEEKAFWILHSDFDLAATYKLEMSQGRYFSEQFPSDASNAYVMNEAAAKEMNLKSPLFEEIRVWGRAGKIIGVVKDFHFASFHSAIEPVILRIPDKNEQGGRLPLISIRFRAGALEQTLSYVKKVWEEQMKGIPLNYYFFDDELNAQYNSERRMSSIFKYFSFLSVLLACTGLFGLTSLSTEQRIKEIGIRKVLGASVLNVAAILSKEFLMWVVLSNIIAFPIAWYFMHGWLQEFAYRISLSWWMFLFAGAGAVLISLLTVGFRAVKAAMANPVDSLRYE